MLNEKECKKILERDPNKTFSDEDIKRIRDFLYVVAKIDLEKYKNTQK